MLRRTKAVVAGDEVPPREELTVFIPLTETQRFWTYRLLTKMDTPDLLKIFTNRSAVSLAIKMEDDTASQEREIISLSESSVPPAMSGAIEGNRKALPHSRARTMT